MPIADLLRHVKILTSKKIRGRLARVRIRPGPGLDGGFAWTREPDLIIPNFPTSKVPVLRRGCHRCHARHQCQWASM